MTSFSLRGAMSAKQATLGRSSHPRMLLQSGALWCGVKQQARDCEQCAVHDKPS